MLPICLRISFDTTYFLFFIGCLVLLTVVFGEKSSMLAKGFGKFTGAFVTDFCGNLGNTFRGLR